MAENSFQPFTRRQTMIRRDFEIYRYRYMDEVELHHHDFYEIYMLLRGSVSYTVENRIFHMRAGDLMLISPLELHQARVDSNDEPYERIVLWVDRGYLESLSTYTRRRMTQAERADVEEIRYTTVVIVPRCAVSWTSCAACTCRKVMAATCWPFAAWWS